MKLRKTLLTILILGMLTFTAYSSNTVGELKDLIEQEQANKTYANCMANSARNLGYSEDHFIIQLASETWFASHDKVNKYNEEIEKIKSGIRNEYPVALDVWERLDLLGYNNYVKAGILGNMMAEVGGQTLALQPYTYGGGYYGLCQWSLYYCPDVNGKDVSGQIEYLESSIKQAFDSYGFCYKSGFDYDDFLNLQCEREASLAFAECYERCNPVSNWTRQNNAEFAYKYFEILY